MGAQGTATLDFGAFPGKTDATVDVTGQAAIASDSEVEAWILPAATVEHTADEHMVEAIKVFAGNIVVGTGFTIYGFSDGQLSRNYNRKRGRVNPGGSRLYGRWNIGWVWN